MVLSVCFHKSACTQQHDPLRTLLFCNTVQPLVLFLVSGLTLGYSDDFFLRGDVATVPHDVSTIAAQSSKMVLVSNAAVVSRGTEMF